MKKYKVTYGYTVYYTKEFEAESPDEAKDMAEEDWCDGGEGWKDTENGEGLGVLSTEEVEQEETDNKRLTRKDIEDIVDEYLEKSIRKLKQIEVK